MSIKTKGVRTTHPDYDRLSPYWRDCRNVAKGQRSMHAAGEIYIDMFKDEKPEDYRARIKRSNFFNGFWRTIAGLKGMAFRIDPTRDILANIEKLAEDITLSGVSLDAFASNVVEEVLEVGRVGILVDHPPKPNGIQPISVAAAEQMGLRPTLQLYQTESIRNWRFTRVANAWVLSMATLCETHRNEDQDEFGHESETRYRVLDLDENGHYRQRVFAVRGEKDVLVEGPIYPLMNGAPMTVIPFITVGQSGKGDTTDEPPLIDLVDANVALYQVNSDRRHGLHFTGMPTAVVSGYTPVNDGEKLYIGSTSAWVFPDPNAKAVYLEFTGQGLDASKDMSMELKQEMAMLGARMLADESRIGSETLGGTQIKHQGENSMLGELVGHASGAIEWALEIFGRWSGGDAKPVYQINRRFLPVPMAPQEITALVGAMQSGAISEEDLFVKFQQGEVIRSDKTFEEHQEEVKANPQMPAPAKPAANDGVAA